MTRVFVAGPIDFQDVDDVIDYRLALRQRLQDRGLTPVDQYSELLDLFVDLDASDGEIGTSLAAATVPDEPFVDAVGHAIEATSMEAVLADPGIVPRHTPEDVIEEMVTRDLSLLEGCSGVLAYLPEPSCGTMVEILRARRESIPVVVVSERPSHYVQYYADEVVPSFEAGVERIEARVNRAIQSETGDEPRHGEEWDHPR